MEKNLLVIIDFILNRATEKELIAIRAALDRRSKGKLATGKSLSDMVTSTASKMTERMTIPMEQIQSTVRDMVIRLIKQNAPDISDEQLNALLKEWVPDTRKKSGKKEHNIPSDALITMINQFIAFSIGQMPKQKEITLRKEMPDWPEKYWNAFPEAIQISISSFLKGNLNEKDFWNEVYSYLR